MTHFGTDRTATGSTDLTGDEIEQRPGGHGLGSGQVPYLSDCSGVCAQSGQADGDVGNIAVGVEQVGVAEEVGALADYRVGEDPLPERRLGDPRSEEVRCRARWRS